MIETCERCGQEIATHIVGSDVLLIKVGEACVNDAMTLNMGLKDHPQVKLWITPIEALVAP